MRDSQNDRVIAAILRGLHKVRTVFVARFIRVSPWFAHIYLSAAILQPVHNDDNTGYSAGQGSFL